MGSVIDTFDCPVCKEEATRDFYYRTGEEYCYCPHCGFQEQYYFPDDSKGQLSHSRVDNPFGAFSVTYKDSMGTACGSYRNQEEQLEHQEHLIAQGDKVKNYTVSQFIDGGIVETVFIDNP